MNADLPTFTNAFGVTNGLPTVHLLGYCQGAPTRNRVRRQIEKWQTKVLARALFRAWGVANGYQIEKKLVAAEPHLVFEFDRPRLFHGMYKDGSPAVVRALAKKRSKSARWVRKAMARDPVVAEWLADQIWRLLDPAPMRHVDWVLISEALMPSIKARILEGVKPEVCTVLVRLGPEGGELSEYFVPRSEPLSIWGFMLVLLQLRRWEITGNLVAYYLQLLEACDRCFQQNLTAELAALMPECAGYLAACFGRVHIGPTHQGNVEYQLRRLDAARKEFEGIRGEFQIPRAIIA